MFDVQVKAGNRDLLLMLILQFMFLSDRGFRLPIAQFPSSSTFSGYVRNWLPCVLVILDGADVTDKCKTAL